MDNHDYDVVEINNGHQQANCSCGWQGKERYTEAAAYYDAGLHRGAQTGNEED